MRNVSVLLLSAGLLTAVGVGCGTSSTTSGSGGSGTGGGDGGATSITTSNSTTTGSGMDCTGLTGSTEACAVCAEGSCCAELSACLDDAACSTCLMDGTGCDTSTLAADFDTCLTGSCETECAAPAGSCARFCCTDGDCGTGTCDKMLTGDANVGVCVDAQQAAACDAPSTSPSNGSCVTIDATTYLCNPITNEGCDTAAGEACDFGASGFECYPAPNDAMLCDACASGGPYCAGGTTCF